MPLCEVGNPFHPSGSNEVSPRVPTGHGQTSHSDAAAYTVLPIRICAELLLPTYILLPSYPDSVPLILIAYSSISSDCSNPLGVNRIDYSLFSMKCLLLAKTSQAGLLFCILSLCHSRNVRASIYKEYQSQCLGYLIIVANKLCKESLLRYKEETVWYGSLPRKISKTYDV